MRKMLLASVGAAASLLMASSAMADVTTITFAGNLTNATYGNATGAYSGTASYHTPGGQSGSADQGLVVTDFSITSPVFSTLYGAGFSTVTNSTFNYAFGDVIYNVNDIVDNLDQFELVLYLGGGNGYPASRLTLDVIYPIGTMAPGYQLPTSLPPISQASVLSSRFDGGYSYITFGNISNFSLTTVGSSTPEPGVWALSILGFAATGAMLRRRRALGIA